ncbi:MAG: hypothetical protein IT328_07915 [Caldilineaceae bacterium]|nr:hypothetical protein [Caldilineaceae bacterium]
MSILQQPTHLVNEIDGRMLAVSADVDHSYTWVNGKPVFTDTQVIEIKSVNHENVYQQLRVVLPLAEAISMAKAILATQQADEDEAYDAWIEKQYQQYLDHQALADDALCHEVAF